MKALLLALVLASPATAQMSVPVDTSGLASKADVAAASALLPQPCVGAPAPDIVGGTAGTGIACTHRANAASATQVMPSTALTLADGSFSGTWPGAFTSAPTITIASMKTTTDPYTCQIGSVSTAGYVGKCWKQTQQIVLPATPTALLGLALTAAAPAPAGMTVQVVGRQ